MKKRKTIEVSVNKLFNVILDHEIEEDDNGEPKLDRDNKPVYKTDSQGRLIPLDVEFPGFKAPGNETPEIDEDYVFDPDNLMFFLTGIGCNDRILLTGPTGAGKTTFAEQVAARLNYNVVKLSFDGAIRRDDLVGFWQYLPDKGTVFQEGLLTRALKLPGTMIILDEWDTISAECAFVIQRLLQKDDGSIVLYEKGGDIIKMHDQSVIVATANTIGLGDETGLYSRGTAIQNYSQINRFGITIKVDYPSVEIETQILSNKFDQLEVDEISAMIDVINKARQAYVRGEISVPLSTRDLINWAEKFLRIGSSFQSAQVCFLNRMPARDASVVSGLIKRIFDDEG